MCPPSGSDHHDISDRQWALLAPHLPGQKGVHGGVAQDNRRFINAVLWILRTGSPWRSLPPEYGDWKGTHRRFSRWRDKGIWEKLLEVFMADPAYEWMMIDPVFVKMHLLQVEGAKGEVREMSVGGGSPRYICPWMRLVCRSELLLQVMPRKISRRLRTPLTK